MALRPFIKLVLIGAWSWGSWAFITSRIQLSSGYVDIFYKIFECLFFAALLLFIEKFFLQLIGKYKIMIGKK